MQRSAKRRLVFISVALVASAAASSEGASAQPVQVKGVAVNGDALTEDSCEVLAATRGSKPELREVPGMHVLDRTEADPLVLTSTTEVKIRGVMCWRSEARLAPNDYLVPYKTGFSLYLKTDTGNEATDRAIVLEKVGGSFRVRLVSGPPWSPAERNEMQQAIRQYNQGTRP